MELRRYLHLLRQRWLLIAITMVVAIGGAYVVRDDTTSYTGDATIYVGSQQLTGSATGDLISNDAATGLQAVARTFAIMIGSEPIARDAIERSGIDRSASAVAASTLSFVRVGTNLVIVTYTDPDPAVAQQLTNAIADAFVQKVQEFEPGIPTEGSVPRLPAYVFDRASLPVVPNESGGGAYGIAALFGFVFAAAVAFVIDYLDLTVKTPGDLERRGDVVVLGVVPIHRPDLSVSAPADVGRAEPASVGAG
jgi:receptor protein-tyrosine kinase